MTDADLKKIEEKHGQTVAKLLSRLDTMPADEWRTLVRWAAPKMVEEEPNTLMEIICQRASRTATDRTAMAARIAEVMEEVGVRLVVAD